MKKEKMAVVIDGANIIHNDKGIRVRKKDGKGYEKQIRPERLASCIRYCIEKGWDTLAILKRDTITYAKHNPGPLVGDISVLDEYFEKQNIMGISKKKEDIFIVEKALQNNAWIISFDNWKDEKEKFNDDYDWEDVNSRTLRDFEFIDGEFILPSLPNKKASYPRNVSFSEYKELYDKVEFLENRLEQIEEIQKAEQKVLENDLTIKESNDVVNYVVENMLGTGDWISVDKLYSETSKAVLGTKKSKLKDAGVKLRKELGYSKSSGFLQFLIKRSNKKIRQKKKGGQVLVSYN